MEKVRKKMQEIEQKQKIQEQQIKDAKVFNVFLRKRKKAARFLLPPSGSRYHRSGKP